MPFIKYSLILGSRFLVSFSCSEEKNQDLEALFDLPNTLELKFLTLGPLVFVFSLFPPSLLSFQLSLTSNVKHLQK
jgi:hypothetical protein